MDRTLTVLVLAAVCLVACGTASTSKENWAYVGPDAALKSLPPIPRENLSSTAWQQAFRENMEAWLQKNREAADAAKGECARDTGESGTPGLWTGYSSAFLACMKARGWSRVSNPL